MVMDDICVCRSIKCPRYDKCMRGDGYKRPEGIYTVSDLAEVCNQNNNYEMYIGEQYDKRIEQKL